MLNNDEITVARAHAHRFLFIIKQHSLNVSWLVLHNHRPCSSPQWYPPKNGNITPNLNSPHYQNLPYLLVKNKFLFEREEKKR